MLIANIYLLLPATKTTIVNNTIIHVSFIIFSTTQYNIQTLIRNNKYSSKCTQYTQMCLSCVPIATLSLQHHQFISIYDLSYKLHFNSQLNFKPQYKINSCLQVAFVHNFRLKLYLQDQVALIVAIRHQNMMQIIQYRILLTLESETD